MNTQKVILYLLLGTYIALGCFGCRDKSVKQKFSHWVNDNKKLIKEQYDSTGKITSRQWFNTDTVASGAEIFYYPNGKIEKWKWYGPDNIIPYAVVYFDTIGRYSEYKGIAFIDAIKFNKNDVYIEMINPPNVKFLLCYTDSFNNKLKRKTLYEPGLTDSVAWVKLDEHIFKHNHAYTLMYYFLNRNNKIVDSFYQRLDFNN